MRSAYFRIEDSPAQGDDGAICRALSGMPGVLSVSLDQRHNGVAVDFDSAGTNTLHICDRLETIGYAACLQREQRQIP